MVAFSKHGFHIELGARIQYDSLIQQTHPKPAWLPSYQPGKSYSEQTWLHDGVLLIMYGIALTHCGVTDVNRSRICSCET